MKSFSLVVFFQKSLMISTFQFFYFVSDDNMNHQLDPFFFKIDSNSNLLIRNNFCKLFHFNSMQVQATWFYYLSNLSILQFHIFCNGATDLLLKNFLRKYSISILLGQPKLVSKLFSISSSNSRKSYSLYVLKTIFVQPFKENT